MKKPAKIYDGLVLKQLLTEHYNITDAIPAGDPEEQIIAVKTGDDFPWRIRINKEGWFVLDKQWSARTSAFTATKPKWYQQKKDKLDITVLYLYIIKRHNKSCEWMTNWEKIIL